MHDDDSKQLQRPDFLIGQDLPLMSVGELENAIARLESEITRLVAERDKRDGTRRAAEALFGH